MASRGTNGALAAANLSQGIIQAINIGENTTSNIWQKRELGTTLVDDLKGGVEQSVFCTEVSFS